MTSDAATTSPEPQRFDGAATWADLTPDVQAHIGALALELVVAGFGQQLATTAREERPFAAALEHIGAALDDAVLTAVPRIEAILDSETASIEDVPLPTSLGPVCMACGCSQNDACGFGCSWAAPDLCSACVGRTTS